MSTSPFTRSGSLAAALVLAFALAACGPGASRKSVETLIAEAEAGRPGAVGELVAAFGHPDAATAQKAWEAVVKLGPAAEDELVRALGSSDRNVSEHAAGALGAGRLRGAVGALGEALDRPGFRGYAAAWALGEIGDADAVPVLVGALGSADGETRKYAVRALVKFGPQAVPSLLEALDSPSAERRRYAVRALGEIRDPRAAGPVLEAAGKVDREIFLWALGRLGDPRGLPHMIEAAGDADWRIRLAAVQALGDLGLDGAVPVLTATLQDEEWIVREWSARGLESVTGGRYTYRDQHGEEVYPYNLYH